MFTHIRTYIKSLLTVALVCAVAGWSGEARPAGAAPDLGAGHASGSRTEEFQPTLPLAAAPSLLWSTFMGSSGPEQVEGLAVDPAGNIYVVGWSSATWGSPVNPHAGQFDAFVAKFNPHGVRQWNTFLGSFTYDYGYGIAVDWNGNVYVAGYSDASWGTPINPYTGGYDVFLAKLDGEGQRLWQTFMGSTGTDYATCLAVDAFGDAYVGGHSSATWGVSPLEPFDGGSADGFVAKVNADGVRQWNTFLGGSGTDVVRDITLDANNGIYTGGTSTAAWGDSPRNAYKGGVDTFAAKLDPAGTLAWLTFMGGAENDYARGIAVDASKNVYLAGYSTASWGSPLTGFAGGGTDGFAAKLSPSGDRQWHTFMGSGADDQASDVAVDSAGNVYVSGHSKASWGNPAMAYAGLVDAFAVEYTAGGALDWSTFMGSVGGNDYGSSIAVDASADILVAGRSDLTWGAPLNPFAGFDDVFLAKWMNDNVIPAVPETLLPNGLSGPVPVYFWKPSSAASNYQLVVYRQGEANPVLGPLNLNAPAVCLSAVCDHSPGQSLSLGTYSFQVRAGNVNGWSAWSPLRQFTVVEQNYRIYLPLIVR